MTWWLSGADQSLMCVFTPTISLPLSSLFFFNDTATTEIYTLSLHDALPISHTSIQFTINGVQKRVEVEDRWTLDRKSTRLNSSHLGISYAVFCLKKKKQLQPLLDQTLHHESAPHAPTRSHDALHHHARAHHV